MPKNSRNAAKKRNASSKSTEQRLKEMQTKMNYMCKLNQKLQPAASKTNGGVLSRIKRSIDNNRMTTAFFMLFLNIGSRYINLNFTSSQEYYIRKMLIPEVLIFSISWMGSRDILIAASITLGYSLITRLLLNENSNFCIVKAKMQQVKSLIDTNNDNKISDKELENAIKVLAKAKEDSKAVNNLKTQQSSQHSSQQPSSSLAQPIKEESREKNSLKPNGILEYPDDSNNINNDELFGLNLGQMSMNEVNIDNMDLNEIPTFEPLSNSHITKGNKAIMTHGSMPITPINSGTLEPFTSLPSVS